MSGSVKEEQSPVVRVGDKVAPKEGTLPPHKIGKVGTVIFVSPDGGVVTVKFPRRHEKYAYPTRELLIQSRLL
jgi:hypothetical protein